MNPTPRSAIGLFAALFAGLFPIFLLLGKLSGSVLREGALPGRSRWAEARRRGPARRGGAEATAGGGGEGGGDGGGGDGDGVIWTPLRYNMYSFTTCIRKLCITKRNFKSEPAAAPLPSKELNHFAESMWGPRKPGGGGGREPPGTHSVCPMSYHERCCRYTFRRRKKTPSPSRPAQNHCSYTR